jgi:protein gp37
MSDTKIEWASKVWNPVRGCSKVSEGCRNCYAIKQAHRFSGEGMPFEGLTQKTAAGVNWTGKVTLVNDMLLEPLKWRKHERVFVNSMSDLFHDEIPDSFLDEVFGVMLACKVLDNRADHSFMILTKRPERMQKYLSAGKDELLKRWSKAWDGIIHVDNGDIWFSEYVTNMAEHQELFPLPNVWLGVSVESDKVLHRIDDLRNIPAAIRFLSVEPLLGGLGAIDLTRIDWVIVGGESGHGARPMHPNWARSLRDQCQEAGVAFFFKQWGEWWPFPDSINELTVQRNLNPNKRQIRFEDWYFEKNGKKAAGRMLDDRTWDEFPNI